MEVMKGVKEMKTVLLNKKKRVFPTGATVHGEEYWSKKLSDGTLVFWHVEDFDTTTLKNPSRSASRKYTWSQFFYIPGDMFHNNGRYSETKTYGNNASMLKKNGYKRSKNVPDRDVK